MLKGGDSVTRTRDRIRDSDHAGATGTGVTCPHPCLKQRESQMWYMKQWLSEVGPQAEIPGKRDTNETVTIAQSSSLEAVRRLQLGEGNPTVQQAR